MTMLRRHPFARSPPRRLTLCQCRTIPDCDRVNEVNTPTTYSWIRRSRLAWNTQIRIDAMMASTITPFENTSRSPRFSNCRGRKRSRARIEESRGKSWKEVLAARTRMAAVKTWTR